MSRQNRAALAPLAAVLLSASAAAETFTLERTVLVMRHGIRAPFVANVVPEGVAEKPWPAFSTPFGELTPRGAAAMELLGRFDRAAWTARGLRVDCGAVRARSNNEQRTIATAEAWLKGAFPECNVAVAHEPAGTKDALFQPFDVAPEIDSKAAADAALAHVGSLDALRHTYRPALDRLGKLLGCCSIAVCTAADLPAQCSLADLPGGVLPADKPNRPKVTGIFDYTSTAAQTLMLQYLDGMPMKDVSWGRATPADLELVTSLHTMKAQLIQRPPYVAAIGAAGMARAILAALKSDARVTAFVGHDTNINDLAGLLDLHFKIDSYGADVPAPGGALGFDVDKNQVVSAFYRAQTMDQMRDLQTLSAANPPLRRELLIRNCTAPCTLQKFNEFVDLKLNASLRMGNLNEKK